MTETVTQRGREVGGLENRRMRLTGVDAPVRHRAIGPVEERSPRFAGVNTKGRGEPSSSCLTIDSCPGFVMLIGGVHQRASTLEHAGETGAPPRENL